jgi:hypothetical protein
MYRLAQTEDISFLIGIEIIQICVGRNEVIVNGEQDVRITMLGDFSFARAGAPPTRYSVPKEGGAALLELLNDHVDDASATAQGGLNLRFRSGAVLWIYDDNDQFESFWIRSRNREIIV